MSTSNCLASRQWAVSLLATTMRPVVSLSSRWTRRGRSGASKRSASSIASGVVVDTHVTRVAQRLGLSAAKTAEKIEQDLCQRLPQDQWIDGGHRLLLLGRYVCLAKGPKCEDCPLAELCPSRVGEPLGSWQQRAEHLQQAVQPGEAPGEG